MGGRGRITEWLRHANCRRAAQRRDRRAEAGKPVWGSKSKELAFRRKRRALTKRIRLVGKGPRPRFLCGLTPSASAAAAPAAALGQPPVSAAMNAPATNLVSASRMSAVGESATVAASAAVPGSASPAAEKDMADDSAVWRVIDDHMLEQESLRRSEDDRRMERVRQLELQLDEEAENLEMQQLNLRDKRDSLLSWERRLLARERALVLKPRLSLSGGSRLG